jgi:non-specific serine/threonine protein kinase/serine/threonine-protein kinase
MPILLDRLRTVLGGDYNLEQEFGKTTWATTYLATDRSNRRVEIKVLHPEVATRLDSDLFLEGMSQASKLRHAHLTPPLHAGVADGLPYYVVPHIIGVTVRDKLDVHGPAPLREINRILGHVAQGLAHMHERGIPHLTITPDHVLLQAREAKLMDAGVGHAIRGAIDGMPELGTAYLAPECASGTSTGDHSSDIYQVGVLGYELLTGRTPPAPGMARGQLDTAVPHTPTDPTDQRADTPPALSQLITKCLAGKPADRWQSMADVASALGVSSDHAPETTDAIEAVGPYHIRGVLGKGGMGMIYLAEQAEPVKRQVALKVIKLGMDTKEVLARFHAERQALAVMDHPHIAKMFDGGTTRTGRPYFVMELVSGIPITEYCDTEKLSTRKRLELFIPVCEAVQHAHQKGIIHRDLKPSNVLVTVQDGRPVPKVIDFGLAKALGYQLTDRTLETHKDQVLGTPAYMSPEQTGVSGLDVDTRTDVYSLGVMLYEVLAGALPVDPEALASTASDVRHAIRHSDPPKPSSRVQGLGTSRHGIAARRSTDPATLHRQLSGDLDWITMAAIEKDRTRRYETVSGLTRDLQRHLLHEPVQARPPSAAYRVGKFARRHKAGVATALVAVVGLVAGLAATTTLWLRATRAERVATTEAETARQVSDFLEGLFVVSDPREALGDSITARELLDRGAENILEDLEDQPLVQARLMTTMGLVYTNLGLYNQAEPMLDRALDIRQTLQGDEHPGVYQVLRHLGNLYRRQGRYGEAAPVFQQILASWNPRQDGNEAELAQMQHDLGTLYVRLGKLTEAEELLQQAVAIRERIFGPNDESVGQSVNNLAVAYNRAGRYADAERSLRRSLTIHAEILSPDHPNMARIWNNLGTIYEELGRFAEAESSYERMLTIREKVLSPNHPDLATGLYNLGSLLRKRGKYAEAQSTLERALTILETSVGPEHPAGAQIINQIGSLHADQGRMAEAAATFKRAIDVTERILGPDSPDMALALGNLGSAYVGLENYAEAESLLQRAVAIMEGRGLPDHQAIGSFLTFLARIDEVRGRDNEAESKYRRAMTILENARGRGHPQLLPTLEAYSALLRELDRAAEADSLTTWADSIRAARMSPTDSSSTSRTNQ